MAKESNAKKNKKVSVSPKSAKKASEMANVKKTLKSKDEETKKATIEKARRELHFDKSDGSDEITKLIKIVLIVAAIMLVFYIVTTVVTRKANAIRTVRSAATDKKAEIQYDSLIVGSMLNFDGTYYVLIEKEDDENLSEYQTLLQMIEANEEAPKIYTANLSDSFNSQYLGDEGNYDSDLSNFKVKGTTLVKVSDHNIESAYDNYDDIKGKLEEFE